jgi:precorrin-2 dehydrogenase/sirohydrochlorin ferrochelatase
MNCAEKDISFVILLRTPELCDYYLGDRDQRECENCNFNKWKITNNGQKIARVFEEIIPEDISQMVLNLNEYRKTLKVILRKVQKMNEVTASLKK